MPDKNRHDIKLETDRLILRRPHNADAARITELIGDYKISKNMGRVPYPYDFKDAESFLTRINDSWGLDQYILALCFKKDSKNLIGMGGPFDFQSGRVELGYWLGKPYWGNGLMSEAVNAFVELVLGRMKAPFLMADHMIDNPASGRVLEKCGFRQVEKRAIYSMARGEFVPTRLLRIDRDYWHNQNVVDAT